MQKGEFFFFQAEDGIRDIGVTGVQTCALPISDPFLDGQMWMINDNDDDDDDDDDDDVHLPFNKYTYQKTVQKMAYCS